MRSSASSAPPIPPSSAPPSPVLALVLALALLLWAAPAPAPAQTPPLEIAPVAEAEWRAPRWMGDVAFTSVNALIGGLTAGLSRTIRGGDLEDFRDGFTRGALGGAVAYGGRRMAAARFDGAGLLGRQLSATGISIVRNAGEGHESLERLVFLLGPVRLHVDRSDGTRLHPKLALYDLGVLLVTVRREPVALDWSASLSAGAPVFRSREPAILSSGTQVRGSSRAGTILLGDLPAPMLGTTFPHERVHVLQHDFASLLWSDPVEAAVLRRNPYTRAIYRHFDFGLAYPLLTLAFEGLTGRKKEDRLREIEARFLDGRIR